LAYFVGDLARLGEYMLEVKPTVFASLPRFFEKIYARIVSDGATDVKEYFGGRVRLLTSGGAPLPLEVAEFFAAAGLPILQAYGLTENVCVAFNRPDNYKFGTVGPPMPGCEVRIADDKEILVRSEMMFSGYYKAPDETAKMFADGWLLTGDLGEFDADGFLKIIGRKKELIVTSTGKKVSPTLLENMLKENHLISQAMVYGEGRSYLVALITLNATVQREIVQEIVDKVNRRVSSTESIKRFEILDRDFEVGRDEITPTGKLKRDVITDRFRDVIEKLYTDKR
jgi:long-chain acyl-CoA synthetase